MCVLLCVAKYKTLERLLGTTELPALVEQKPRSSAAEVDVFEPLTLTEKFEQTFLVVNFINDGQCLIPTSFNISLYSVFIAVEAISMICHNYS